jgi:hypothetical protein
VSDASGTPRVEGADVVEGTVTRRDVGAGSKSEHVAVVIDVGAVFYLLRSRGGNAFADPALDLLVGHRVRLEGTAMTTTFVIDRAVILDDL